jgi:hypothetical protein
MILSSVGKPQMSALKAATPPARFGMGYHQIEVLGGVHNTSGIRNQNRHSHPQIHPLLPSPFPLN